MTGRVTRRTFAATPILTGLGLVVATHATSASQSQSGSGPGDPAEAAVDQSRLEVADQIWDLYRQMHQDSIAEVPLFAVQYWYDNSFLPRGPQVLSVTDVQRIDWTWPVNGKTYPHTAELSFRQQFARGSAVEDKVRLVAVGDQWRWFFGRSRDFIDHQIALASPAVYPDATSPAPDWADGALRAGVDGLDSLPDEYPGDEDATIRGGSPSLVPRGGVMPTRTATPSRRSSLSTSGRRIMP